jgi:arginyl-tRNA synthetase
MVLAKAAKKKPRDIAEALLPRLKANPDVVDGAVAGPGFINLKLRDDFWRARLGECLKDGRGLRYVDDGRWAEGQRRVCLGQSDRAVARGACAWRGGG